jgi:hypothetical protein
MTTGATNGAANNAASSGSMKMEDIKPKNNGGMTPCEVLSRPRVILSVIFLSIVPLMALIVFLTTCIEGIISKLRPTIIGRAVQAKGKDVTKWLATRMMKDVRNADMLYVVIGVSAIVIPLFIYCFIYELTNKGMIIISPLHTLLLIHAMIYE